jgi:hypothetical protein
MGQAGRQPGEFTPDEITRTGKKQEGNAGFPRLLSSINA